MEFFTGSDHPFLPDLSHYTDDDFFHAVTILTSEIHHPPPPNIVQEQKQKLVPVRSRSSNSGPNGALCDPQSPTTKSIPIKDVSSGRNFPPEKVDFLAVPAALDKLRAGLEAECRNIISEASDDFEAEFSTCSADKECDSSATKEGEGQNQNQNQKKKKKEMSAKKLELVFENMSNQLMQKLEQMHKQAMEMIMERERESIILEEAWKQQEIEWTKRRLEERALETSRNQTLISFIQNLVERNNKSSWTPSSSSSNLENHKLVESGEKRDAWKEIAARLGGVGYKRTPAECRGKHKLGLEENGGER